MALNKITSPLRGYVNRKGVVYWCTSILIGASGAITSQDGLTGNAALALSGLTVTKQATAGQYLIQIGSGLNTAGSTLPGAKFITELDCNMIGAPSGAAAGQAFGWLTNNMTAGTKAGNILLQAYNLTPVAANVDSGNTLIIQLGLDYGL